MLNKCQEIFLISILIIIAIISGCHNEPDVTPVDKPVIEIEKDSLTIRRDSLTFEELLDSLHGSFPRFHIKIDEKYLFSEDSGLFVVGINGKQIWTGDIANYFQDWEFPCSTWYSINGETQHFEKVGFQLAGHSNRLKPNKSIALYWRDEYGDKNFKGTLFEDQIAIKFKRVKLRNGGNDPDSLMFKQTVIERIVSGLVDLEIGQSRPCVLYINDTYWGLYDMREMLTSHYFDYLYGIDDETVNILRKDYLNPGVSDGKKSQFVTEVSRFLKKKSLESNENYEIIKSKINLESFIDFMVVETYIKNWDWPLNNTEWWNSEQGDHQKWKWILGDLDWSMRPGQTEQLWLGDFYKTSGSFREDYDVGFSLFNKLMENEGFRKLFLERYLEVIDNVFLQARVSKVIDDIILEVGVEYERHNQRWPNSSIDYSKWIYGLERLKEFNDKRTKWLRPVIQDLYDQQ